ncbi:MAG TPA: hypothetical protein VE173_16265, partial [Longimicrobiales bacterium]|nr:hypothetical protein [Longimicrobiales bacterium]
MASGTDVVDDLQLLVRSRYGLIRIVTAEEERAHTLLAHLADAMRFPLFTWTRSRGLVRDDLGNAIYDTREPLKAFQHVALSEIGGLYHFMGVGQDVLEGSLPLSHVRDAARSLGDRDGALVMTGDFQLPPALDGLATTVTLPGPG